MKTKMITIPFDLERAKRIQEGKEEGKIITGEGEEVRIICWDVKSELFPLVVLITRDDIETPYSYTINGFISSSKYDTRNLILLVPEYTQYKDGDILINNYKKPFIFKGINDKYCNYYVGITLADNLLFNTGELWCDISVVEGYANEKEKQRLIHALQDSKEPLAKKYLKEFFGITKEEFKPFDRVLVRMDETESWEASLFSNITDNKEFPYLTVGGIEYAQCISYNDQTEHLLGTSDDWD